MSSQLQVVQENLNLAITQLCNTSWMFVKDPAHDFTKDRKLPLHEVISILPLQSKAFCCCTGLQAIPSWQHFSTRCGETIGKNLSVVRTGRRNPRNMIMKHAVSFLYRAA